MQCFSNTRCTPAWFLPKLRYTSLATRIDEYSDDIRKMELKGGAQSIIKYYSVQKTRVYDEIVKGILSQASRCLHTLHEFHRGLEIINTATQERRPHMWRHAPEYFKIVAAIPQRFTGSFGQDTNAADILVGHGARVNTRVAHNLQHSRNGYPGVALEVYLHPRQHD